jgi:C1A family cysteine protease
MRGMFHLLETVSLLFLSKQEVMVPPNFMFCLMRTKDISETQVCDYFSDQSYFRGGSLQDECNRFMSKRWVPSSIEECGLFIEDENMDADAEQAIVTKWNQFLDFMIDYDKSYVDMDDIRERYLVFHDNLDYIHQENDKNHSYKLGINQFADWTHEEYKDYVHRGTLQLGKTTCPLAKDMSGTLPASIDWRSKGAVNAIQDQGQCGSCWTFSSSSAIEGAYAISTGKLAKLSEQNLVDCAGLTYGSRGCSGGLMDGAFNYVMDHGIASESSYPYTAKDGSCKSFTPVTKISSCYDVPANELQLTYALTQHVVSIAIQADGRSFQLYSSGVFDDAKCYQGQLDHGVSLVGYGHDSSSGKDYYILRNSWATTWGVGGYMYIGRNSVSSSTTGVCGLAMMNSYPVV